MATDAVCPSRSPAGMLARVIVVAYVTTELLVVAVGALAVTVASAVSPGTAGKVTTAFWPTVTEAMSASAMLAVTVMAEASAIVAKPDEEDEVADDDPVPAEDDDAALDEPDPVPWPTAPLTAITRPAIGAVSVVAARLVSSLASDWESVVTWF